LCPTVSTGKEDPRARSALSTDPGVRFPPPPPTPERCHLPKGGIFRFSPLDKEASRAKSALSTGPGLRFPPPPPTPTKEPPLWRFFCVCKVHDPRARSALSTDPGVRSQPPPPTPTKKPPHLKVAFLYPEDTKVKGEPRARSALSTDPGLRFPPPPPTLERCHLPKGGIFRFRAPPLKSRAKGEVGALYSPGGSIPAASTNTRKMPPSQRWHFSFQPPR